MKQSIETYLKKNKITKVVLSELLSKHEIYQIKKTLKSLEINNIETEETIIPKVVLMSEDKKIYNIIL